MKILKHDKSVRTHSAHKYILRIAEENGKQIETFETKTVMQSVTHSHTYCGTSSLLPLQGKALLPAHQKRLLPAHQSPPVGTGRW
jgi:hypothetical protein